MYLFDQYLRIYDSAQQMLRAVHYENNDHGSDVVYYLFLGLPARKLPAQSIACLLRFPTVLHGSRAPASDTGSVPNSATSAPALAADTAPVSFGVFSNTKNVTHELHNLDR